MINKKIATEIAKQFYDKETFEHAMRVAEYAVSQPLGDPAFHWDYTIVAILHDILEDTDIQEEELAEKLSIVQMEALKLLTKPKHMKYSDYCQKIRYEAEGGYLEQHIAYIVKLADMKDHLSRTETLTERLKEKYLKGLSILL